MWPLSGELRAPKTHTHTHTRERSAFFAVRSSRLCVRCLSPCVCVCVRSLIASAAAGRRQGGGGHVTDPCFLLRLLLLPPPLNVARLNRRSAAACSSVTWWVASVGRSVGRSVSPAAGDRERERTFDALPHSIPPLAATTRSCSPALCPALPLTQGQRERERERERRTTTMAGRKAPTEGRKEEGRKHQRPAVERPNSFFLFLAGEQTAVSHNNKLSLSLSLDGDFQRKYGRQSGDIGREPRSTWTRTGAGRPMAARGASGPPMEALGGLSASTFRLLAPLPRRSTWSGASRRWSLLVVVLFCSVRFGSVVGRSLDTATSKRSKLL